MRKIPSKFDNWLLNQNALSFFQGSQIVGKIIKGKKYHWQKYSVQNLNIPVQFWGLNFQFKIGQINKYHSEKNCTDMDSLIGNFGCRNSTVWKFSNFPTTLILCEINFGSFQRVKICRFNNFEAFEFWLIENSYSWKMPNSNFRAAQTPKW